MSALAIELPGDGLALSDSVDVFEGARAAVLAAPGLFRLDVTFVADSLRLVVRNMSGGLLACSDDGYGRPVVVQGDRTAIAELRPGHHQAALTLLGPGDAVEVRVILATLRLVDAGLVRITAQATIRRAG